MGDVNFHEILRKLNSVLSQRLENDIPTTQFTIVKTYCDLLSEEITNARRFSSINTIDMTYSFIVMTWLCHHIMNRKTDSIGKEVDMVTVMVLNALGMYKEMTENYKTHLGRIKKEGSWWKMNRPVRSRFVKRPTNEDEIDIKKLWESIKNYEDINDRN